MKVIELIRILQNMPTEAETAYLHTTNSTITIDEVEHRECFTPAGKKFDMVVLSATKEG